MSVRRRGHASAAITLAVHSWLLKSQVHGSADNYDVESI